MSKQTAVDKFHDAVNDMIARRRPMTSNEVAKIWLECKEVEKEQHEDTWLDSRIEDKGDNYIGKEKSFEQYYNETYGNEK